MGNQEGGPAGSKVEVGWPMRVFGRDVAVAEGVDGNVVEQMASCF